MDDLEKIRRLILSGNEANLHLAESMWQALGIGFKPTIKALGLDALGVQKPSDLWMFVGDRLLLHGKKLADISPLRGGIAGLNHLYINDNKICNIEPLADFGDLLVLALSNNQVEDIAPLRRLGKLEKLHLDHNPLVDIAPLGELPALRMLSVSHTRVEDVSSLNGCPMLSHLYADSVARLHLDQLQNPRFNFLKINYNRLKTLDGLAPLPQLEALEVTHNGLEDISALSRQRALRLLDLSHNRRRDLEALRGLLSLESLRIVQNPNVKSIEPLFSLPNLRLLQCSYHIDKKQIKEFKRRQKNCLVQCF